MTRQSGQSITLAYGPNIVDQQAHPNTLFRRFNQLRQDQPRGLAIAQ